ncbi:MAG: DUF4335 domain-containing protein [Elainellaceae cyanobacterium]
MTIQRHYDLPNCRLVIEGWSSDAADNPVRPVLSMVTNAECHVTGHSQPLRGGREFMIALAQVVSTYAQGILSNIPRDSVSAGVRLDRLGLNKHRLIVRLDPEADDLSGSPEIQQLDLTTVQLFDLVEAVDQMVADAQTLPELVLPLSPVSRRFVAPQEPLSRRLVPAALGVSGVAAAAIALFFIPPPEFRPAELERDPSTEAVEGAAPTPDAAEGPEPIGADSEDLSSEGLTESEGSAEIEPNRLATGLEADTPTAIAPEEGARPDQVDEAAIDELFANAVPLSDPEQIDALVPELRQTISRVWEGGEEIDEALIYRVGTNSDGAIIGFRYINDAALEYVDQTPLLSLTQLPQGDGLPLDPIGQFRVVLRPSGVVEVSPWYGRPVEPSSEAESEAE